MKTKSIKKLNKKTKKINSESSTETSRALKKKKKSTLKNKKDVELAKDTNIKKKLKKHAKQADSPNERNALKRHHSPETVSSSVLSLNRIPFYISCIETMENQTEDTLMQEEHAEVHDTPELNSNDILNSKKKKRKSGMLIQRSEPSFNITEFNLTEIGKEKVKLKELIKTSRNSSGQMLVKKQLENAKKLKSLSVPLSKPQLEKIKRTVAYEKVCNEVSKWDPVVRSNRTADQIVFPLKKEELRLESLDKVSENFVTKHPVEVAVSELLQKSENILDKEKVLTPAEEKALQAMSLEEAKLRHSELMRHRALISYREAKARRQNKIKSKRYHRILKREKLKKMMKEFEELQKTDAAAALEKFLEADKLRILERMTLKHRNTGKWAKQQRIRAKYNPESRSNLKEDILIGRQLREKIPVDDSTIANLKAKSRYYSANVDEPNMDLIHNHGLVEDVRSAENPVVESGISVIEETTQMPDTLSSVNPVPVFQTTASSSVNHIEEDSPLIEKPKVFQKLKKTSEPKKTTVEDEKEFSSEAHCLDSLVPDDITFGDEDLDDVPEGVVSIQQAFADEDLIAEFKEEKKAADKANRPEGIDLFLPGWGSWGGPGIKPSKRKRQRFFIKAPEPPPKKNTLGNVIINEDKDKKAAEHQVSNLPFPFSNIHQFESYIRQPIGHTWNPQSSFQNLVAPKVVTKLGKIIEPIDADDVVLEKRTKQPAVKKFKKKVHEIKAF